MGGRRKATAEAARRGVPHPLGPKRSGGPGREAARLRRAVGSLEGSAGHPFRGRDTERRRDAPPAGPGVGPGQRARDRYRKAEAPIGGSVERSGVELGRAQREASTHPQLQDVKCDANSLVRRFKQRGITVDNPLGEIGAELLHYLVACEERAPKAGFVSPRLLERVVGYLNVQTGNI